MQLWLSYHIYPLEAQDVFLARAIRPFLEQTVWPVRGARAFYIRYEDAEGPHIRLRVQGEEIWLDETVRPRLGEVLDNRGSWKEVPYEPEIARFGGPERIGLAEAYFHLSTRVVLDRLNGPYTYGDALFDALRMHTATAFAAGLSPERAGWYFEQLAGQWVQLFFRPAEGNIDPETIRNDVFAQFEQSYEAQAPQLKPVMFQLWEALQVGKLDANQPEWKRWLEGNQLILKDFGSDLDKVLPSLLHLTNNRLGLHNQDEAFVCYLLGRLLQLK